MKKRYKLKKWVKVVITLAVISVGIIIYNLLGIHGSKMGQDTLASILISLGWFYLIVGQIGIVYSIWEE